MTTTTPEADQAPSTAANTPSRSNEPLIHLGPKDAASLVRDGRGVIIDVREPDEYASERIAGAINVPLTKLSPRGVEAALNEGDVPVLHCGTGVRSAQAAQHLIASGWAEVRHIEGGIKAWKKAGQPIETPAGGPPISIMRQVQITAGSITFIGTALGVLVTPWLLILPAFIGAGLTFAGATGTCGMAALLAKMPWNKATPASASCAAG